MGALCCMGYVMTLENNPRWQGKHEHQCCTGFCPLPRFSDPSLLMLLPARSPRDKGPTLHVRPHSGYLGPWTSLPQWLCLYPLPEPVSCSMNYTPYSITVIAGDHVVAVGGTWMEYGCPQSIGLEYRCVLMEWMEHGRPWRAGLDYGCVLRDWMGCGCMLRGRWKMSRQGVMSTCSG